LKIHRLKKHKDDRDDGDGRMNLLDRQEYVFPVYIFNLFDGETRH
jgi:hypothetical protein